MTKEVDALRASGDALGLEVVYAGIQVRSGCGQVHTNGIGDAGNQRSSWSEGVGRKAGSAGKAHQESHRWVVFS